MKGHAARGAENQEGAIDVDPTATDQPRVVLEDGVEVTIQQANVRFDPQSGETESARIRVTERPPNSTSHFDSIYTLAASPSGDAYGHVRKGSMFGGEQWTAFKVGPDQSSASYLRGPRPWGRALRQAVQSLGTNPQAWVYGPALGTLVGAFGGTIALLAGIAPELGFVGGAAAAGLGLTGMEASSLRDETSL
ncbi:MAG: hypothetical protein RIT81_32090 [Deltaproteobacteria bacterium]